MLESCYYIFIMGELLKYTDEISNTRAKYGHQAGVENLSDIMLGPFFYNPTMRKEHHPETRKKKYQKPATTTSGNKPPILCLKSYDHTPFFNVLKALQIGLKMANEVRLTVRKIKQKHTNVVEHDQF